MCKTCGALISLFIYCYIFTYIIFVSRILFSYFLALLLLLFFKVKIVFHRFKVFRLSVSMSHYIRPRSGGKVKGAQQLQWPSKAPQFSHN